MKQKIRVTGYLNDNLQRFLDDLADWLAIPSISTLPEHREDVGKAAIWAKNRLTSLGFPKSEIIGTEGHPLVYGEWLAYQDRPTLLIYGHYDVQPVDPLEEWTTPPFAPSIRAGRIYGRGACDDKGQVMLVLAALEAWIKMEEHLPVNVKILLEGEEEAGGRSIAGFVPKKSELLAADAVLICDTHIIGEQQPSLITSLRGILYTEITVFGARIDLHSGSYGGVAPNPLHALCLLLGRLKDESGTIHVPGLEELMPSATAEETLFWRQDVLGQNAQLQKEMGVDRLFGEAEIPAILRIGLRPTLEIHGIRGGYVGQGAKTVIPATASAKVSMRLPAGCDPAKVFALLEKAIKEKMPEGYRFTITNLHAGAGITVPSDDKYITIAADCLREVYGKAPVFMREGGSIPIAAQFAETLKVPIVFLGFGLPDDTVHAPNESFSIEQFRKGMQTIALFLGNLGMVDIT